MDLLVLTVKGFIVIIVSHQYRQFIDQSPIVKEIIISILSNMRDQYSLCRAITTHYSSQTYAQVVQEICRQADKQTQFFKTQIVIITHSKEDLTLSKTVLSVNEEEIEIVIYIFYTIRYVIVYYFVHLELIMQ